MAQRILIIEDSPTMRQLLSFTLKRLKGVEIVQATDGVDGLKKMSEGQFDLILTDINMPMMDGLKLVSLVRGDPSHTHKDVPIVIITTEGGDADRDKGMALGANSYITKPINSMKLIDTVKEFLPEA